MLLQAVIILIGISALAFMLVEPHFEGRNANATFYQVYFNDPFLAYAYVGSIPFFVALYKIFTLIGYARQNNFFSPDSIRALRTIKRCALTLIGFVAGAVAYFFLAVRGEDDIAGGVAMGLFVILLSAIVASVAAVFERKLQS